MKIEEIVKESFKCICEYYRKDFEKTLENYIKSEKSDTLFDTLHNRKK